MPKRCPPGVFCLENTTLTFMVVCVIGITIYLYFNYNTSTRANINNYLDQKKICNCNNNTCQNCNDVGLYPKPSYSFSNVENDILLNPYSEPVRDNRIFNNYNGPKVAINIPTQSFDTNYRQIGILTKLNGGDTILPLMGRPLFSNRDKWNFYTMNDKNNMIKLPITFKNKSCTSDIGCDNVYNGDLVYVEGYNEMFKVTVYDNDVMRYIPYL